MNRIFAIFSTTASAAAPASNPHSPSHFSPQETPRSSAALLYSTLIFFSFFIIALTAITLLNGGWVNHTLNPVGAYFSMFMLIWPEQPLGALEFILTKSFIVLAHKDPRSALNLWTLEYDAITLIVYSVVAILLGRILARRRAHGNFIARVITLTGAGLLVGSVTYMTAIEHCSGATWVGFVSLYGMGFDGFDLFPIYQWILAFVGAGILVSGLREHRT